MDIDLNELLEKMKSALAEENWQLIEEVIDVLWQHLYIEEANEFAEDNGFWEE